MVTRAKPNYIRALKAAIRSGKLKTAAGQVVHIDVAHDDWCAIFKGGICNCDPEVSFRPARKPKQ